MRIFTNVSKAELDHLTGQPTAKAMIEKVRTEGIYIPEGDARAAAEFVAARNSQRQDTLDISDDGRASMEKELEEKESSSQEDRIKKKISELQKELAEINDDNTSSEKSEVVRERKVDSIMQQISTLSMQLVQLQKAKSEANI
ncbi:MAG: hypothetical protein J6X60_04710 [Ruminiclostridium sp.]|nr:hypothetical protein [Ruminiclostridium sp.]